jgi:hypothetical protein
MSWLEDALASIAASGEGAQSFAAPKADGERDFDAWMKARGLTNGYGLDASSPGVRFAMGDSPTPFSLAGPINGVPAPTGPGLPAPTNPLGMAGSFPTGPVGPLMANPAEWSPFGPPPVAAPGAPSPMAAQPALAGLTSPVGAGGAPFSIAGAPPSLGAAKEMTAPPVPQPPPPGIASPGAGPAAPAAAGPTGAAPVVAQDDGAEDAPVKTATDFSSRNRAAAPVALPAGAPLPGAPVARPPSIMDVVRGISPDLVALGAGLSGHGWGASQELAAGRAKKEEAQTLQLQQGNATARLLASKGASPQEIAAAVAGGPDVMKALVGQYIGKDKFKVVQTGENDRGKKTFQLMNEQDGTFKDIPGAVVAADSPSEAAAAAGITGDSFLKTVPNAQDRSLIKQLTQYDLDPGKLSARGGNRERLLALAEQYDPDFKAALYAPRAAALKEFTSGGQTSPAAIITNGNTAIQHLGRMSELADRLGGTNKGWILNGAINWANVTIEDMKNNPDLARFKGAQDRFVEEATKFYRGVGGNKSDIDRALHILTAAQSPEARQAAIQEQAELMGSKVNALQDRFKSAVGPSGWKKAIDMGGTEFPIVQQKSQEELDKIRKRVAGEKVDAAPAAKAVKPGNYVYRNGALVAE